MNKRRRAAMAAEGLSPEEVHRRGEVLGEADTPE